MGTSASEMQLFTVILSICTTDVKKKHTNVRIGVDRTRFGQYTAGVTRRGNTLYHVGGTFCYPTGYVLVYAGGVRLVRPLFLYENQKNKKNMAALHTGMGTPPVALAPLLPLFLVNDTRQRHQK